MNSERFSFREMSNGSVQMIDHGTDEYFFVTGNRFGSAWRFCTIVRDCFLLNDNLVKENLELKRKLSEGVLVGLENQKIIMETLLSLLDDGEDAE